MSVLLDCLPAIGETDGNTTKIAISTAGLKALRMRTAWQLLADAISDYLECSGGEFSKSPYSVHMVAISTLIGDDFVDEFFSEL